VQVKNAEDTRIYAVNNSGAMVGQYIDFAGIAHGLKLVGNKLTTLDDPSVRFEGPGEFLVPVSLAARIPGGWS